MKKRVVLCLMLGCLIAALVGCDSGELKETLSSKTETEEEKEDSKADDEEKEEEESEEKEEESEKKKSSDKPVLGGEDVEGYEGFEYLYEEVLMTDTEENEETGKKERKKLTVYIPDDDYATASGNYAYSDSMGVNFTIQLEPYLRYDAEDYLPEENLEEYINNTYDPFYTAEYKDMVISDVEKVGKDAARCTVEYCAYDKWDEAYYTVFATYYLAELEDGATVLVSVEINDAYVTGKVSRLIKELEQFYQFEIDWDKDRAEQKRLDYAANETENMYSTGNLMFELPQGWKEDYDMSDYETKVYAPDGDYEFSECFISVYEEYLSYDETVDLNDVIEANSKEELEESAGASITEYSAEICETGLGEAAKISYTISDGEDSADGVIYFVVGEFESYTLMAMQSEYAVEDAVMVLDGIMATAQMREY